MVMNNKNNNNNHRAYSYGAHETEICHNGKLGCWVEPESFGVRALRWARCIMEGAAFGLLVFGFCALCAVA